MNELLQRLDPLALGSERGISAHPLRDFQRIGRIELAIQIGMDQQDRVIIRRRRGHGCFLVVRNDRLGTLVSLRSGLPLPGAGRHLIIPENAGQLAYSCLDVAHQFKKPGSAIANHSHAPLFVWRMPERNIRRRRATSI